MESHKISNRKVIDVRVVEDYFPTMNEIYAILNYYYNTDKHTALFSQETESDSGSFYQGLPVTTYHTTFNMGESQ